MILAAGLSPAWQQILVFDRFRPGGVNRAANARLCARGKSSTSGSRWPHLRAESRTLSRARRRDRPRHPRGVRSEANSRDVDRNRRSNANLHDDPRPVDRRDHGTGGKHVAAEAAEIEQFAANSEDSPCRGRRSSSPVPARRERRRRCTAICCADVSARCMLDIRGPELLAALESPAVSGQTEPRRTGGNSRAAILPTTTNCWWRCGN